MLPLRVALRVVWVSDDRRDPAATARIARAALAGGVRACILREPALDEAAFVALCRELAPDFARVGAWLVAHERTAPTEATLLGSGTIAGVHRRASSLRSRAQALGFSTHSAEEVAAAAELGAAYAMLGAVFPTKTHPGEPALGVAAATRIATAAPVPVVAIGGITAATARTLAGGPFVGVACMRALGEAPDVAHAAADLVAALTSEVRS